VTAVTLTHSWHYGNDCHTTTGWTEHVSGIADAGGLLDAGDAQMTVAAGDYFGLLALFDDVGDEYAYYELDITDFTPTVDSMFFIRWKTQSSGATAGFRAKLVGTGGNQWMVGESAPQYSALWTVTSGSISTSIGDIDKIQLWIDDYPDTYAGGIRQAWVDWILLCKQFTFPHIAPGGVEVDFPERHVYIGIPGRGNPITQYTGAQDPITITLRGDMMNPETWGSAAYPYGEYLLYAWRMMYTDLWQYVETDKYSGQVTVAKPVFRQLSDSKAQCVYDLMLKAYKLSNIDLTTWGGLQFVGK